MSRFFRNFRKESSSKGKKGSYLLYALGEIVLVVIGILIAFQIDSNNEKRKKRDLEIKTYRELKSELEESLRDARSDLQGHLNGLESTQIIQRHLFGSATAHDSLAQHFMATSLDRQFDPKTSAYQSWLSQGIGILTNDSVRQYISKLYLDFDRLKIQGHNYNTDINFRELMAPFVAKYIKLDNTVAEERNYMDSQVVFNIYEYSLSRHREMLRDDHLKVIIQEAVVKRGNFCGRYFETVYQIEHALKMIDRELERLD